MSDVEEALASGEGGISSGPGGTVATGPAGIAVYQLVQARVALRLEVNGNGMVPSRAVCAKTIIPWLVTQEITDVRPPYTKARKVKAWQDLNAWMTEHGFKPMSLTPVRPPEKTAG